MRKYEKKVMDLASKLDTISKSHGEITENASLFIQTKNDEFLRKLLSRIASIYSSDDSSEEVKSIANVLEGCMVKYCGYLYITSISQKEFIEESEETLSALMDELSALVGLKNVKKQVNSLIAYHSVQLKRQERGLLSQHSTLHMAFTGNPGTGKTTVARIVGRLYKQIGLLSKGHFIEASRTDLIAGYQGQTALKVKELIEKAKGGVLFIDEAYSITENENSDSYGRECLTELTKALEDYREDLVVIVAGYTEPMKQFFKSNPGLRSRFNTFIEFEDYSSLELSSILESICKNNNYILEESLKQRVNQYFEEQLNKHDPFFSNGRLARNIFDDLVMNHAIRVNPIKKPTDLELSLLLETDFSPKTTEYFFSSGAEQ